MKNIVLLMALFNLSAVLSSTQQQSETRVVISVSQKQQDVENFADLVGLGCVSSKCGSSLCVMCAAASECLGDLAVYDLIAKQGVLSESDTVNGCLLGFSQLLRFAAGFALVRWAGYDKDINDNKLMLTLFAACELLVIASVITVVGIKDRWDGSLGGVLPISAALWFVLYGAYKAKDCSCHFVNQKSSEPI